MANSSPPYTSYATRREKQRVHWPTEDDYLFVCILAKHCQCDAKQGVLIGHKPVENQVIGDVERNLTNHVSVENIVQELAIRYPNKREEGRSAQAIELLIELKHSMPGYEYQQLNHKHINLYMHTIEPFFHIFEIGRLFRTKTILQKDNKRFVKAVMEFYSAVINNGRLSVDPNMYVRKAGKGVKLLEQWLTAMLNTHGQQMANMLYAMGIRMACTYISSKPATTRTPEEAKFLQATTYPPKVVQMVLKEYMNQITKHEAQESVNNPSIHFGAGLSSALPNQASAETPNSSALESVGYVPNARLESRQDTASPVAHQVPSTHLAHATRTQPSPYDRHLYRRPSHTYAAPENAACPPHIVGPNAMAHRPGPQSMAHRAAMHQYPHAAALPPMQYPANPQVYHHYYNSRPWTMPVLGASNHHYTVPPEGMPAWHPQDPGYPAYHQRMQQHTACNPRYHPYMAMPRREHGAVHPMAQRTLPSMHRVFPGQNQPPPQRAHQTLLASPLLPIMPRNHSAGSWAAPYPSRLVNTAKQVPKYHHIATKQEQSRVGHKVPAVTIPRLPSIMREGSMGHVGADAEL